MSPISIPNFRLSTAERRAMADAAGRAAPVTPPMSNLRRTFTYGAQLGTGRPFTPRQRRRYRHKANRLIGTPVEQTDA